MQGATPEPIVSKYVASGLNREAVPVAVANYGDNPAKVYCPLLSLFFGFLHIFGCLPAL